MRAGRFVVAVLAASIALTAAPAALADITPVTPDLVTKVTAMATAAKAKFPTSPREAADHFMMVFNGEFGDIQPVGLIIEDSATLTAALMTPLVGYRSLVYRALLELKDLPTSYLNILSLLITPKTMNAPQIERVVVFHGETQVEPLDNLLTPAEYKNRLGASITRNAGSLSYATSLFDGGQPVRVILFGESGPYRTWTLSAEDAKKVR